MFNWLYKLFNPDYTWDKKYETFLKGLTETKHPKISSRCWVLGYIYEIKLDFNDVRIRIDYNMVRKKWTIETWSRESNRFLFYGRNPREAIDFMINRYNLRPMVDKALAKLKERDLKEEHIKSKVINKYIGVENDTRKSNCSESFSSA